MYWRTGGTTFVLWLALLVSSLEHGNAEQRVVCYYTNWSVYRPGTAKYSPQNINPYLCTHLIYAFGGFTKDNLLKPFDKYQDIEKGGYAKFTGLKTYNKKLKTMLAIGGWNEGSSRFSPMVADPNRRKELVKNTVKFLRQNHFDGLDLDWEYPAFRDGGKPRDKDNYADLVQELREEFERESSKTGRPRLLLSMAIPAGIEYLEKGYDLSKLNEYLDFFNLLSYDYHSAFEPSVNHHAPLYGLEEDNEYNFDSELTIDFTINYLLKHEVTSDKIVLGIPTYGRSYTLVNDESTEIGSPAEGPGEEGDATREKGYLAYYEICENIAKSNEWEVVQPNPKAMGPYAFKGNQWVGYDDENIVRAKALYVNEKKLGGIMFWSIDNDDFRGKCNGRPYPLIEAAKETLLSGDTKNLSGQKTKTIINRKKTKAQTNRQRDNEESNLKLNIENKKNNNNNNNKVQPTRKRITSSRPSVNKSKSRDRAQIDPVDEDENDEQKSNPLRESSNKNRAKTRTRSRLGNRRKEQNSKQNEETQSSESDLLSNKLTTPEPPTTPDPGSDFKCEDEGFFSHPRDCKKYFWCLDSGPGGLGVVAHAFTCPSGLVFNKAADSCDYPRNVVCPKANTPTTTKSPIILTTSRTTTTTESKLNNNEEEEEEEYEDEEINTAEELDDEIPVISTTSKPHQYKTINRSRPTTTTTTTAATTEAQTTTITSRIFKTTEKEINFEDEEDPRVIKELIDLIKKAGGLEQLEKQLNYQGKDKIEGNDKMTPATISRSLYERVLSRQATKLNGAFGITTPKTTTTTNIKQNTVQNAPGKSQFEGLDDVPEVKSLRRTSKPHYVTIERQKTTVHETSKEEEEDDIKEPEENHQDNDDVASVEDGEVSSSSPEIIEKHLTAKKVTPSYVNIRRSRPTTPAHENDLDDENESIEEPASKFLTQEQNEKVENEENITKEEEEEQQPVPKSRYTNTHRFRSTTLKSNEFPNEDIKPVNEVPFESTSFAASLDPEIPKNSIKQSSTTQVPSVEDSTLISTDLFQEKLSVTKPSVQLVDNSVTEILLTTLPALSSTKSTVTFESSTNLVTQPRPFGVSRRGRPTTTSTSTTIILPSSTESSRTKVSNRPTRNFARPSNSFANRVRTKITSQTDDNSLNNEAIEVTSTTELPKYNGKRRGINRFTTASSILTSTTEKIPKLINKRIRNRITPAISQSIEETTVPIIDARSKNYSVRRRGRPTGTPIDQSTGASKRRLILKTKIAEVSDSPIIRIAQDTSDLSSQIARSKFIINENNTEEKNIKNIKVFKMPEDITELKIEQNIIETLESDTIRPETSFTLASPTTTSTSSSSSQETTTEIGDNDINETESMSTTVEKNNIYLEDTTEVLPIDSDGTAEEAKPIRRRVALRRRPVSTTTEATSVSSDELNITENPPRRRKILKRVRPVFNETINESNSTLFLTTTLQDDKTITENINEDEVSTTDSVTEISTFEPTTLSMTTDDFITISGESEIENTTFQEEEIETIIPIVSSTTTVPSTSSPESTTRFVKRKFIRKRPLSVSSTTTTNAPISSTIIHRFGIKKNQNQNQPTEEPSKLFGNNRRKSLFVRRRPVLSSSTTSKTPEGSHESDDNDELENPEVQQENHKLPTLKQLIGETIINSSNITSSTIATGITNPSIYQNENDLNDLSDNRVSSTKNGDLKSSHVTQYTLDNKNYQGKKVPVKILGFGDSETGDDHQFAFLNLPDGVLIPNNKKNILRIQVLEQDNIDEDRSLNKIENHRVSKSRVWNDLKPRSRGSRNKIKIYNSDNIDPITPRQSVSKRRGTQRFHTIDNKNLNEISSTDVPITTVMPTTTEINSGGFTTIMASQRGFFVTKNIDKNSMIGTTTIIPDSSGLSDNLNIVTTEIPYTTQNTFYELNSTTMKNEFATEKFEEKISVTVESITPKSFESVKDFQETLDFSESEEMSTTSTSYEQVTDKPLWTLLMKYFDETTITSEYQDDNKEIMSSEKPIEFSTSESLEKSLTTTTDSIFLKEINQSESESTISFETTTVIPLSTIANNSLIKNKNTLITMTKLPNDTDNELNNLHNVPIQIKNITKIPIIKKNIDKSSTTTEKYPEITTVQFTYSPQLITEKNHKLIRKGENKRLISISKQKEEIINSTKNDLSPSSSTSTYFESTPTTESTQINPKTRSHSRGKVRFQESPRVQETRYQKPSSRQSFRQRSSKTKINENNIEIPKNNNQSIEISQVKKIQELPVVNEMNKSLHETFSQRRRNSSSRNRVQTSSTTMQSFILTTEIPQKELEKINVQKDEQIESTNDQIIAESSHFEAIEEVSAVKNTGVFLRRPVSLVRPSVPSIRSQTINGPFFSRVEAPKSEKYFDQNSNAQEQTVSRIDPTTIISSFKTGKDTSTRQRDDQKHQFVETIFETTTPTTVIRTTSARPRQRPKNPDVFDKITQPFQRKYTPIIDYDYYVDEDARLSIKPELKNKIYMNSVGRISCLDQGTFAHPVSCKKFITCTKMAGKKIIATEYTCPTNLSFDPVGGICNWSAGLGCNNH